MIIFQVFALKKKRDQFSNRIRNRSIGLGLARDFRPRIDPPLNHSPQFIIIKWRSNTLWSRVTHSHRWRCCRKLRSISTFVAFRLGRHRIKPWAECTFNRYPSLLHHVWMLPILHALSPPNNFSFLTSDTCDDAPSWRIERVKSARKNEFNVTGTVENWLRDHARKFQLRSSHERYREMMYSYSDTMQNFIVSSCPETTGKITIKSLKHIVRMLIQF